jgi:hypothetical protein
MTELSRLSLDAAGWRQRHKTRARKHLVGKRQSLGFLFGFLLGLL